MHYQIIIIIIITVDEIKSVVFILPRKRPAVLTTSTGPGGAAMVFCRAVRGSLFFRGAGPCSAGRPSLVRAPIVDEGHCVPQRNSTR